MYQSPHFEMPELSSIQDSIDACGLTHLVTWMGDELVSTALPMFLVREEGPYGTLYGHVAKANGHWELPVIGEGLCIFSNVDTYVSPSWYAAKAQTGKVVPTWNYEIVHASGIPEFFTDEARLLDAVTHLTERHESVRSVPWRVEDAPADFIKSQLRGIVGLRMPITRLQGKRKMSQNRPLADREGVAGALRAEGKEHIAKLIPVQK
jgi:transcriptional regulator